MRESSITGVYAAGLSIRGHANPTADTIRTRSAYTGRKDAA